MLDSVSAGSAMAYACGTSDSYYHRGFNPTSYHPETGAKIATKDMAASEIAAYSLGFNNHVVL
jgi:hypothetical protein